MAQLTTPVSDSGADIENTISDLTDLPHDIFLLIISHFSPAECILCRRVSQSWNAVFGSYDVSWNLMRWHFPRAREMKTTVAAPDWVHIFSKVARRYFYLRSARPRQIQKIEIASQKREDFLFHEVEPWSRWLMWKNNVGTFQHRDLSWCLDDGLLIYRERTKRYVAYDLETGVRFLVPFDGTDKIVRRLRLAQGTLVIEWCERKPCCQLDDGGEDIHRHFATAFDVQRSTDSSSWEIRFRCEWKLHQSGLPVNHHARFFSAHTSTHYALYLWQYDGSLGDEELPEEQLTVWEIGVTPSHYLLEGPASVNIQDTAQPQPQPRVIKTFAERALDFLGIRQREAPMLREVFLDEANVYVHEEGHPWLVGQHSPFSMRTRHHHVRSTGFPFSGVGPRWFDECSADGTVHLTFCPRVGSAARLGSSSNHDSAPDYFRRKWPGWAPCWRHEEFPYLTISDVVDEQAGVRIAARQCLVIETLSSFVLPKISLRAQPDEAYEVHFADDMWKQLLGKGKIMGDERWVVGEDSNGSITVVYF
ncbi:hypothetical protein F4782DRAFT_429987 [Xylaria castorea]|nr:hypothetical protein F4782DRAFT_429987 [Xylaria castorea]